MRLCQNLLSKENICGVSVAAVIEIPLTLKLVEESINRLFFSSLRSPKSCQKSTPTIGFAALAIIKIHCKCRRRPISKVTDLVPHVVIREPFAAQSKF